MHKYVNSKLFLNVTSRFESVNTELWTKEGIEDEPKLAPVSDISSKVSAY